MVLSSVLNQGSRLLRSSAALGAAAGRGGRGAFRNGQQTCRAAPSPSAVASGPCWTTVRVVGVNHRAFWDWPGKGGDQGSSPKGSGGAAEDGGRSGGGGGPGNDGKGKFGGSSE